MTDIILFPPRQPRRVAIGGIADAPFNPATVDRFADLIASLPRATRMSDEADIAAEQQDVRLASRLSRINPVIPEGVQGECDECGEVMPRLVGGRCGYCRDGRKPPLSRFDDPIPAAIAPAPIAPIATAPAPAAPPAPINRRSETMGNQSDARHITIQARGDLRTTIEERASARGVALGRVAEELVRAALDAEAGAATPAPAPAPAPAISLADVPFDELIDEITGRMAQQASPAALEAEKARADAAEIRAQEIEARFDAARASFQAAFGVGA